MQLLITCMVLTSLLCQPCLLSHFVAKLISTQINPGYGLHTLFMLPPSPFAQQNLQQHLKNAKRTRTRQIWIWVWSFYYSVYLSHRLDLSLTSFLLYLLSSQQLKVFIITVQAKLNFNTYFLLFFYEKYLKSAFKFRFVYTVIVDLSRLQW